MEKIKKVKHIKEDRKITKEDKKIKRAKFIADIQKLLQRKNKELPLFDLTIGQWLEKWAKETPDKEAIVYSDRDLRFTYAELNQRVNRLAKGFIEIGVTRGSHVGIWATNVPDWLTIMYACTKIGAICITVNTNYQQSELEYLCKDSDMQTLCLIDRDRDTDYIEMVYKMLPELRTCQRGELKSEKYPKMKNVVFIGQEKYRGMYNTQELFLLGDHTDDNKLNELRAQTNCHDVINMQYTSGTTGFPKGVMLTHYNIANNGFLTGEHMKFTSDDKLCCCVPLFHCFGIVLATMNCITHGCTQVMVERFDPLVVLASIHKERCTAVYGVPTMFIAELNHPMFKMFNMKSLRTGIMAGSLCPIELMKEVEDKMYMKVTSVYGLTEASPGMTHTRIEQSFIERCTTVGYEFEHTDVKVINPETGEFCKPGEQGELCNKGYNNMKGYYNNPEATAETIDKNGYLHSGDLGIQDEHGNYKITGRIKDMIIRGGENIYPREIEEFLYHMEGIKDVQVAGIPSKKYGEAVGAFIILQPGADIHESDVKEFCKNKIARFKIPKYVLFVKEFPLTGSGKIQKFKLKDIGLQMLKEQGVEVE
ncbi:MAG: AMP-binding protein [Bacteroidales bacterium]|jgi:fatty-acyl-CoA synthase|nr:AMP-binding protein [Bacteroidales bacterium]MCI1734068.1 AMP-binding protein [Bacteroidales bacterium]